MTAYGCSKLLPLSLPDIGRMVRASRATGLFISRCLRAVSTKSPSKETSGKDILQQDNHGYRVFVPSSTVFYRRRAAIENDSRP